jgi:hypothetical protein
LENYYVDPPLYKDQELDQNIELNPLQWMRMWVSPDMRLLKPIAENAVARCFLFGNPTQTDKNYMKHFDEPRNLTSDLMRSAQRRRKIARNAPQSNDGINHKKGV